ncbi:hypothetical protein FNV43_RR00207 [Rhamnella rubrinervis]|uniref:Uncharacterized protein n=1 Tax=Rhamnella rubrinervis TaxID=2594499 RepID=A0A8K0HNR1_9ROSA|nr:hypothetical protein FNV43_RR00207 [Rhamnella rubrinervis]
MGIRIVRPLVRCNSKAFALYALDISISVSSAPSSPDARLCWKYVPISVRWLAGASHKPDNNTNAFKERFE